MTIVPHAGPFIARTITNPIRKEEVIFLEISRESGGHHTLIDVLLVYRGGNPMHYHDDFSEEFTCLEGELSVQIGGKSYPTKTGRVSYGTSS